MSWMPLDAGVAITVRSTPMSEFHLWEHKTSINIIKSPARNLESYIMRLFCCHVDASDSISEKPRSQFSRTKFAVLELSPAHWLAGPPGSPGPPGPHAANLVADLMLVWIACFERISVAKLHDLHFDTSIEEIVWLLYPLVKIYTVTHLETPRRETMKWDEMRIHVSSCWVFGFAQLPYWDYCRYTRLIRPCIPLQGIASLHWVCQGVPNAPARWYTNSKRTIETHVLHAWRCTDVSDWNLYATWTSSR